MIKVEISEHVETALGILEKFVIDCDHKGIISLPVTDAIRVLRGIPKEIRKDADDPDPI